MESGKRPTKCHFKCNKYTFAKACSTSSPAQNLNQSASGRKIHLDDEVKPTNDGFKRYRTANINLLFEEAKKYWI